MEREQTAQIPFKIMIINSRAEIDQRLIQSIIDSIETFINKNFSASMCPFNVLHIALDLDNGRLIRIINVVPNTQIATVLSHNNIGIRNPLNIITPEGRRNRKKTQNNKG